MKSLPTISCRRENNLCYWGEGGESVGLQLGRFLPVRFYESTT